MLCKNFSCLLPILFLFVLQSFGQADFIKDYTFFGVNGDFVYYKKGYTDYGVPDSPVTVYHMHTPSFNAGLSFNVYHHKRLILKTGFGIRYIYAKKKYHIDYDQTEIIPIDYIAITSSDDIIMYIPLRGEYLIYKKFFVYSSITPGYYTEYGGLTYSKKNSLEIFVIYPAQDNWFYLDWSFGFGVYIPTKYALIQPYVCYNKSFHNMWHGSIHVKGIKNRPYTEINGTFEQSGNYVGFGINIYPKKFWRKN